MVALADMFYGISTIAFNIFAALSAIPYQPVRNVGYRGGLVMGLVAYGFRMKQLATKNMARGAKVAAVELLQSNNTHMFLICLVFMTGSPNPLHLVPPGLGCAYQGLTFLDKHLSNTGVWKRYGKRAYNKAHQKMVQAFAFAHQTEIVIGFMSLAEVFMRSSSLLGPMRPVLYWHWLKMRYQCTDNTILRVKYPHEKANYYHHLIWQQLNSYVKPYYSRIGVVHSAVQMLQRWFTS